MVNVGASRVLAAFVWCNLNSQTSYGFEFSYMYNCFLFIIITTIITIIIIIIIIIIHIYFTSFHSSQEI